jgi:hypothetical protein
MPWTGQHISFYSVDTLRFIAKKYNLNFYTNGKSFHLFTKIKINKFLFKILTNRKFTKLYSVLLRRKKSLLAFDYDNIVKLSKNQ